MIKTVRVGLIGCGKIAEIAHMPAYQVIKKAQLVAVCDKDEKRARWLAERFGIRKYSSDPIRIIENEGIDAVDICLPTFLHSKFIRLAAEAGKHVFCEKPMAKSVKEAERVISQINKSGINLMVGYNQRFERTFQKMKAFIDSGLLGDLISLEMRYAKCETPERYLPPNWRADPKKGGGALLDFGCHKIDLLRWFAGEVHRVSAISAHNLKTEAEDAGGVILDFKKGALGLLSVSLVCASPFKELDSTDVYGSKGTVRYRSDDKNTIHIYLKGSLLGRTSRFTALKISSKQSSYTLELKVFIDSIIKERKPSITAEDAKKVLEIVEAARKSAKQNKTIVLAS